MMTTRGTRDLFILPVKNKRSNLFRYKPYQKYCNCRCDE